MWESRWGHTVQSSLLTTPGQSPCWPHSAPRNTHFTESSSEAYQHPCTHLLLPIVTNGCVPQQHLLYPGTALPVSGRRDSWVPLDSQILISEQEQEVQLQGSFQWTAIPGLVRESSTFMFCKNAAKSYLLFLWINQGHILYRGLWRSYLTFWLFSPCPYVPQHRRELCHSILSKWLENEQTQLLLPQ